MLFNMFKKTMDETVDEVFKARLVKDIIFQIADSNTASKFVKDEIIEMRRKVNFLHEAEQKRSNMMQIMHFVVTIILAGTILVEKFV